MSMPDASTPSAIAVLPLTTICGSFDRSAGNRVLEVEVRLAPGEAGLEQLHVGRDDLLVLLAEDARDLVARELHVEAVDAAQHAEHEHVLAAARVGHQRAALALERDLDRRGSRLRCSDFTRLDVRRDDLSDPCARATCSRAGSSRRASARRRARGPSSTCSLNATTRSVSSPPLVTALRADADPDAARAGDAARRRLDLGRDDLDRPDAVAAARGDRAPATGRNAARPRPSR